MKSEIANKQKAEADQTKAALEIQNKEISIKKGEADAELAKAQPVIAMA